MAPYIPPFIYLVTVKTDPRRAEFSHGRSDGEMDGWVLPYDTPSFEKRRVSLNDVLAHRLPYSRDIIEHPPIPNLPTDGWRFVGFGTTGFTVASNTSTSVTSNLAQIRHPAGWRVWITAEELSTIITSCKINNGVIEGELIFFKDGRDEGVTVVGSQHHRKLVNAMEQVAAQKAADAAIPLIRMSKVPVGSTVKLKNGAVVLYLGKEYRHLEVGTGTILYADARNHAYIELTDYTLYGRYYPVQSRSKLEVTEIISPPVAKTAAACHAAFLQTIPAEKLYQCSHFPLQTKVHTSTVPMAPNDTEWPVESHAFGYSVPCIVGDATGEHFVINTPCTSSPMSLYQSLSSNVFAIKANRCSPLLDETGSANNPLLPFVRPTDPSVGRTNDRITLPILSVAAITANVDFSGVT